MEKKQLDLDAPLLSVRRFSSTLGSPNRVNNKIVEKLLPHRQHSLPLYKSDWELDEVTKPATVPFLWEQIPGRPKGGSEFDTQSPVKPLNTPRLPPGRALEVPKLLSGEVYKDQNVCKPQIEESPFNDIATLLESLNKGVDTEGDSDLENEYDEYSDALDTLSPTETLSMNCSSGSGLSGYGGSDAKPHGTFSADMQTRDFMMNRFLPAAKAMVLDTPQYVSKKQLVEPEQPLPINKVVSFQRQPVIEQHRSDIVPHYSQCMEDVESEDEDDEYDDSGKTSAKMCGIFSRFRFKNSLCLLNPVPGMRARTDSPTTSAKEASSRLARTAYSRPQTQISDKGCGGPVYKQKFNYGARSHELQKVKSKLTSEFRRLSYSGDLRMTHRSSPYWGFSRGGISSYRNRASQSLFRERVGFLGVTNDVESVKAIKNCSSFQDVSCHQRYKQLSSSLTSTAEKTLYIDRVNTVELPFSESISSGAESLMDSSGQDFASTVESRRIEETTTAKSSVQDIRCPLILVDADTPSARLSDLRGHPDRMEDLRLDQGQVQLSMSSDCSRLHGNGKLDMNNEHILKADDQGSPNVGSSLSSIPIPLPKSPSKSWLWRTLPSGLGTQFHPKMQQAEVPTTGTKWETIVKTSNVHHNHVLYSEELVPCVSQHFKT